MSRLKPHPTPKSRYKILLLKCAEDLLDMRAPLSHEFLVENNVTADECFGLANAMGNIIKGYLGSPKDIQNTVLLVGAAGDMIPGDILAEAVRKESLIQQLHKLNQDPKT